MSVYLKYAIGLTISVMAAIIAWFATNYLAEYFQRNNICIDVQTVSAVLLTDSAHVKDLKATYVYQDSIIVDNLWQSTYLIRNTGNKTIYGGNTPYPTLIGQSLPLEICNCKNVLSVSISNDNVDACLTNKNLYFKQWRKNEYVEITILAECNNEAPILSISNRDIMESVVTYSRYTPDKEFAIKDLLLTIIQSIICAVSAIFSFIMTSKNKKYNKVLDEITEQMKEI